jgi:hypothetical protein
MSENMWGYQPTTGHTEGNNLTGYKVEATDGSIGKVDKHFDEVGSSYLVVDTGVTRSTGVSGRPLVERAGRAPEPTTK